MGLNGLMPARPGLRGGTPPAGAPAGANSGGPWPQVLRPRPLALILACSAAGSLALGLVVATGVAGPADSRLLDGVQRAVAANGADEPTRAVFGAITLVGSEKLLAVYCVLVTILLASRRQWSLAVACSALLPGGYAADEVIKAMVQRPRPSLPDPDLIAAAGFSYPSGHAVNTVCAILVPTLLAGIAGGGRWRSMGLAVALAVGVLVEVSRLVLAVHWPSDLLGGDLVGVAWSSLVLLLAVSWSSLRRHRPPRPPDPGRSSIVRVPGPGALSPWRERR